MFLFFRDMERISNFIYIYTHWPEVSNYAIYLFILQKERCTVYMYIHMRVYPACRSQYTVCHKTNMTQPRQWCIASPFLWPLWTESVSRIPPMLVPHGAFFVGRVSCISQHPRKKNQVYERNENCLCNWINIFSMLICTLRLGKDVLQKIQGPASPNMLRPFL